MTEAVEYESGKCFKCRTCEPDARVRRASDPFPAGHDLTRPERGSSPLDPT